MQISMNNTTFQGRQEVLYGLKQAAKEAKNTEFFRSASCGPRPINKVIEANQSHSAMKAYLDMAVYDDSFTKTISEFSGTTAEELKEILKPQKLQWTEIKPFEVFQKELLACIKQQDKDINTKNIANFLKKIGNIES